MNTYPIPEVTIKIMTSVQDELWGISRPRRIMERISGQNGDNKDLANVINTISKQSNSEGEVIHCAATVYRFIEKAYELETRKIPIVTWETCNGIFKEAPKTLDEEKEYRLKIAKKLREYHPSMLDYIANFAIKSSDKEMVIYSSLVTYGFIEKQVLNDLNKEMDNAVIEEEYERAAVLRDQIKSINDFQKQKF
ncbi:hypothetical protein CL617_02940 [archaeon]|nr:hypothetical protein [archaeon]|tara:strand:- start:5839 stop:6420 length:582 start_codon:yes stop_codon:yes gene_type:complete